MRIDRIIAFVLSLATSAMLSGCSGDGSRAQDPVQPRSESSGIRLTTLVYDTRDPLSRRLDDPETEVNRLIDSLSTMGDSPSEFTRNAWMADGVRLFVAPTEQVAEILNQFRPCRPLQRLHFGEMLKPTPIYSGPFTDRDVRLKREDEILTLPGGMLRLFARCYGVPGELAEDATPRPAIRLDLSLQHADPSLMTTAASNPFEPSRDVRPEEQGGFFRTLDFSIDLNPSMTIVLMNRTEEQSPSAVEVRGPTPPLLPTVGEILLTDFETLPRPLLRTIIVIEAVTPRARLSY